MKININNNIDSSLPHINEAGGNKQKWNIADKLGENKTNIKKSILNGINMEQLNYALINNIEQNPFKIDPSEHNEFDSLCNAVYGYLKEWESFSDGYLGQIMRYTRLMSNNDQPFPIDFFNLDYKQYIYHMKWYKDNFYDLKSGNNYYGLKHRKDTVSCFLIAYGFNPKIWHYSLPHRPKRKDRRIPSPNIVHKIINYDFFPDKPDITKNLQYIHAHNFWLGPRPPSELCLLTLDNINWDEEFIDIIEKKIHYSVRTVYPEIAILKGRTRKSIKNYVDYIRPKFISQYSGNALYITETGRPFTTHYLGNLLGQTGRMVFPDFETYVARHWCATARLISSWINKDPDPIDAVMHFMGHDERSTTEGYVNQARVLFKKYPCDWIKCTLKWDKKSSEESTLKSKHGLITYVSNGNSPRSISGPAEI